MKTWMPPQRNASLRKHPLEVPEEAIHLVRSPETRGGRIDVGYVTVDELFDPIDDLVADSDIPAHIKPAVNLEAHRLNDRLDRPLTDVVSRLGRDVESEIIIDTFDRGSHFSWVATGCKRFEPAESHQEGSDQDIGQEAEKILARLRLRRAGRDSMESVSIDYSEWL